ncbi:MAG: hypothetical protein ACR2L1_00545 [Pyrinomonadaceae bacterium]
MTQIVILGLKIGIEQKKGMKFIRNRFVSDLFTENIDTFAEASTK